MWNTVRKCLLVLGCLIGTANWCVGANFIWVGTLPNPPRPASRLFALSADGTYAVGVSASSQLELGGEAVRWAAATGIQGLDGDKPPRGGLAYGVSDDGGTVAGQITDSQVAFVWRSEGGLTPLVAADMTNTVAFGLSGDGTTLVGQGRTGAGVEAFVWTEVGGFRRLGDLPGGVFASSASAVSLDGSVVVGSGRTVSGREAFRWTSQGMVGLGDLPGGADDSFATALSSDGMVVVGGSSSAAVTAGRQEAFRWTATAGMVGLGDLSGGSFSSQAKGVSGDGKIIVGVGTVDKEDGGDRSEAFIWTEKTGMRSVASWLSDLGIGGQIAGWQLQAANAISRDGTHIAGFGLSPLGTIEGWIADLRSGATLQGDFNDNGQLDAQDIDELSAQVRSESHLSNYDVNADGLVNAADRVIWVEQLKRTYFGDANLDGEFDSSDLILALQGGIYEDLISANATWASGDWNGDTEFDSSDLIAALQGGGFEVGPRTAIAAVPEPRLLPIAVLACLFIPLLRAARNCLTSLKG